MMKKKKLIASMVLGAMLAIVPGTAFAETMTINLGKTAASMDGESIVMDCAAVMLEDGEIMVPVRTIAEAFGGIVTYDANANMVEMIFLNGHWATVEINPQENGEADDNDTIVDRGLFINDRLYIPADLMAVCLGANLSLVDYGQDTVYRLIYHVR